MRRSSRQPALVATALACLALGGCGDEDVGEPIPNAKAAQLSRELDAVRAAFDDRACEEIGPAVNRLQATIASLGEDGVGDDVQDALADGADNLRGIASGDCQPEDDTETTPTETTETTPVIPEPEPDPTTPDPEPPPDTEPLPEEEEEVPEAPPEEEQPDEGGGEGQFDPNGGGGAEAPGQLKKQDDG